MEENVKRFLLFPLFLIVACVNVPKSHDPLGTTYYVSGDGNDANDGLSATQGENLRGPFRNPYKAANLVQPGDTVLLMNGTYTNQNDWSVIWVTRSGTPNAWITYKASPGHHPKLKFNGWAAISTKNASYIEVNGLELEGNNDKITLEYALSQKTTANPLCNGNGIMVDGRGQGANRAHHWRIINNVIHLCGGGGIVAMESDYVTIENNRVFDNCWYNIYANSGISVHTNWSMDSVTGYKFFVRNNLIYNNRGLVPWIETGALSDGNGIIVDTTRNGEFNGLPVYLGRILIQNNICFNNGGSGIHAWNSEHVDIINNTAYWNGQVVDYGQIFAAGCSDVYILNNILYAPPGGMVNLDSKNSRVTYDYNIYFNSNRIDRRGPHDLEMDPMLVNPSINPEVADFHLRYGSPAIDSGTAKRSPRDDHGGILRPQGAGVDRGAWESDFRLSAGK
jgi:parallel beta-helix repeat protein